MREEEGRVVEGRGDQLLSMREKVSNEVELREPQQLHQLGRRQEETETLNKSSETHLTFYHLTHYANV